MSQYQYIQFTKSPASLEYRAYIILWVGEGIITSSKVGTKGPGNKYIYPGDGPLLQMRFVSLLWELKPHKLEIKKSPSIPNDDVLKSVDKCHISCQANEQCERLACTHTCTSTHICICIRANIRQHSGECKTFPNLFTGVCWILMLSAFFLKMPGFLSGLSLFFFNELPTI